MWYRIYWRSIGISEGFVLFLSHIHLFLEPFLFINKSSLLKISIFCYLFGDFINARLFWNLFYIFFLCPFAFYFSCLVIFVKVVKNGNWISFWMFSCIFLLNCKFLNTNRLYKLLLTLLNIWCKAAFFHLF